jgi:Transposase DDE domain
MTNQAEKKYHIHNWAEYNRALANRGSITFWFEEKAAEKSHSVAQINKPGRRETCSDDAIRCGLMNKAACRTALRFLQGFVGRLRI